MRTGCIVFLLVLGLLLILGACFALQEEYKVEVTAQPAFAANLQQVAVVTVGCSEAISCRRVEQGTRAALLALGTGFQVVEGDSVQQALLKLGAKSYAEKLRAPLAQALFADALLEISSPTGGRGATGGVGTDVKVSLALVFPNGEILMKGDGTGKAWASFKPPERMAVETVRKVLARAFERGKE